MALLSKALNNSFYVMFLRKLDWVLMRPIVIIASFSAAIGVVGPHRLSYTHDH